MAFGYSVRRSAPALLAVATVVLSGFGTAHAASPTSGGDASVVLVLRPSNPAALRSLATDRVATAAQRATALRAAAPSPTSGTAVTAWLRGHGFTVTQTSAWTVTASAPAAVAATQLGVTVSSVGDDLTHHGTLRVPVELSGAVAGIVGLDDRPVFHHSTVMPRPTGTLGGPELRGAYDGKATATGKGTTVATLQFSGWRAGDLTDYASAAGIQPLTTHSSTPYQIAIGTKKTTREADDGDGDFEVALDQESILATAPGAVQRMYVAHNSLSDFEAALGAMLTDIQNNVPITALSISWGACEQDLLAGDDTKQLPLIEQSLEQLTAAGVTIFAASGDAGGYDCAARYADGTADPYATQNAVDFPGSSPAVVSVGGTRLTDSASGWQETAWGPANPISGRHVGSGGGFSVEFPAPRWQVGIGGQFTTSRRGVPDISSAADPTAGFGVYEQRLCGASGWCLGGGTSAGAPAQAGLFVSALAAAGRTAGIGDVHGVLYGNPTAFRDIVAGSNGLFSAGTGWDEVTGLGSPLWDQLGPRLLAPALVAPYAVRTSQVPVYASLPTGTSVLHWTAHEGAPTACSVDAPADAPTTVTLGYGKDRATTVSVEAATSAGTCLTATAPVLLDTVAPTAAAKLVPYTGKDTQLVVGWGTAADGPVPSLAGRFHVVVRRASDGAVVWSGWRARVGYQRMPFAAGTSYRTEVKETDRAGNTGGWSYSPYVAVPVDDASLGYHGSWTSVSSSSAYAGHARVASARWSSATLTFTGSALSLLARTTPDSGKVWVNVDGHYARTISLYSPTSTWRALLPAWQGTAGRHTVKLTVVGRHVAASTGSNVWVDGLSVG